ncbi:MAG: ATP-binding cassette domain-containing protein, partial [Bacteroidales bacterium]|nr:ATP-binding cassette domain-containing protein [Bacteroidales bacterium]
IDGKDVFDIPAEELRSNMAIVLQDTVLFADTILNNLKYGCENATDEQIEAAIKISHCDNMIASLPDGLNTMLSPSGSNISQGQRQLIAIARAFVSDPKILILDEATSSVDTRTEKHIQDAMAQIMKDRTSIVIAHRLSTIQDADLIIVMDKGRIVESGNHDELLEKQGKYYELYMTQYAGYEI